MAIGGLTITEPRAQAVDFSYPYFETSVGYFVHVPREMSKAASLLRPYSVNVWIPVLITLVISGPVLWFVAKKSIKTNLKKPLSLWHSYRLNFLIIISQGETFFYRNKLYFLNLATFN
jgi:hypothetical protein